MREKEIVVRSDGERKIVRGVGNERRVKRA